MSGTMSKADLVADLKASLQDAASVFTAANDADFARHLDFAALDLGRVRRRTLVGSLTLVADQPNYAAPDDLLQPKSAIWGRNEKRTRRPWRSDWPGRLPVMSVAESGGARELRLDPAPTAAQISDLGAAYRYFYFAGHAIADQASGTTVAAGDRGLLLLRAQAEAMKEMALRGVTKPIKAIPGTGGMPKSGMPGELYRMFLEEFLQAGA